MTAVFYDGCEWPIDDTCLPDEWDALDQSVKDRSMALASNTLRRLTGYRVGGCPITVRPCRQSCTTAPSPFLYPYGSWGGWYPTINGAGNWINCGCTGECSCTTLCQVALPPPVGEVTEVRLNGGIVVADQYRVDGNMLVWIGDQTGCPWPTCQDLSQPDTEDNTFSVTYLNAYPVDGVGAYAAATLAWEYAQACTGGVCRLPTGVTAVSRQGLTYEIEAGSFPGGYTGIREVDAYIALWNPKTIQREAFVWSPDLPRVHHW